MPLETGTVIADLDESWPLAGDPVNRGDDHLRLIKSILQTQFPGVGGDGFAIPITATEAELNFLGGLSSNLQDQIDDINSEIAALQQDVENILSAPTGTRLLISNVNVPLGWVLDTSADDRYLKINDSNGVLNGGSYNWLSGINLNLSANSTILSSNQIPNHFHDYVCVTENGNKDFEQDAWPSFTARGFSGAWDNRVGTSGDTGDGKNQTTSDQVGGGSEGHTHSINNTSTSNTSFRPSFRGVLMIQKS